MVHLKSDVTIGHKIVNVYKYSTAGVPRTYGSNLSRKDDKPVLLGNRKLVEEMSVNYLLFTGSSEVDYLPIMFSFRGQWDYRPRMCSINVMLCCLADKLIKSRGDMFSVFAPDYLYTRMYGSQAEIASYPPVINSELQAPWR